VSAGVPPLGFAGLDGSWPPPGRDPSDPETAAGWECAGTVPTTGADMLTRLSMMTHRQDVVAIIGSLQGFEAWSHHAGGLRNHLLDNVCMPFTRTKVEMICRVNLS